MMHGRVQVEELVWTLAALPGLAIWARNFFDARKTMGIVMSSKVLDGRFLWARFARELTGTMMGIELVFVVLGVSAMTRIPSPQITTVSRVITISMFVGASAFLSRLALRWSTVNSLLVRGSANRDTERDVERDAERDAERDVVRDTDRDVARDTRRDPPRDLKRDST